VGHGALAAACVAAGVISALVLRGTGWPLPVRAALGPVAVVLALVVADRRKWSRMETSFSFTDDVAELRAAADRLIAQGLPVRLGEEDRGPELVYRHRDEKDVRAALAALGVRTD
jgi:hypothetical protein